MTDTEAVAAARTAMARADESLALLDRVPIADTHAARTALEQTKLEVLSRFREEIAAAIRTP